MKCCCYTMVCSVSSLVTAFVLFLAQEYLSGIEPTTAIPTGTLMSFNSTTAAACEQVECSIPAALEHGEYSVWYLSDCTPYMEVTCHGGYSASSTSPEISYCIDGEWFPLIESEKLCARKCGQPPPTSNADAFYISNGTIPSTAESFANGTEVVYQCRHGYYADVDAQYLRIAKCEDGAWEVYGTLRCMYRDTATCKDQGGAVISLSILCGMEVIAMATIPLLYFWRIHNINPRRGYPRLRKTSSTIPLNRRTTSLSTISGSRISPPDTPKAKTGTGVTGIALVEGIDEDEYYTYAEVPTDTENYIVPDRVKNPDANRDEVVIPEYLEIIE